MQPVYTQEYVYTGGNFIVLVGLLPVDLIISLPCQSIVSANQGHQYTCDGKLGIKDVRCLHKKHCSSRPKQGIVTTHPPRRSALQLYARAGTVRSRSGSRLSLACPKRSRSVSKFSRPTEPISHLHRISLGLKEVMIQANARYGSSRPESGARHKRLKISAEKKYLLML